MELKILNPLYGGMGLARDDQVFFVKGAIPHETVEAEIIEKKRDYSITRVTDIIEPSPYRQDPPCPVYGECGGCHYQHIIYERQLSMKQEIICDCLKRIGKLETVNFEEPVHGDQFRYRYRAQFKIQNGVIGFFKENSHEIVPFQECLLLDDTLNEALIRLKRIDIHPSISEVTVTSGDNLIAYLPSKNVPREFLLKLIEMNVFDGVIAGNGETAGKTSTELSLGAYRYVISANSFLQSNWALNDRLSDLITDLLSASIGDDLTVENRHRPFKYGSLLDVYGGSGNFSIALSHLFKKISVIEENPCSIADGKTNIELNDIQNIKFIHATAEDMKVRGNFDVTLVDPPRIGLTKKAIKKILELAPQQLIYVSCNPATLARDASKLGNLYEIDSVRLVDMFPQTYHCEILCHFKIREHDN